MLVIVPALMVPILPPVLTRLHVPDFALGALTGVLIGLSLAGLAVTIKRAKACP
jgi:hypothetical protein